MKRFIPLAAFAVACALIPFARQGIAVPAPTTTPAISAGMAHSIALRADGTVASAGDNAGGQCNVSGWSNIATITAGYNASAGIRSNGTVVVTDADSYSNASRWTTMTAVSVGFDHMLGLRTNGTVAADGVNGWGDMNVGSWTGIKAVVAGLGCSMGLRNDGTVVAIGNNDYGKCNVSGWTGMKSLAAGDYHTVGLKANGSVVATGYPYDFDCPSRCDVSSWTSITAIAAGSAHTVGLRADGTVVATGYNGNGQCDVSGWSNIVAIAAGGATTYGMKSDGTVICTGDDSSGQCGIAQWYLPRAIVDLTTATVTLGQRSYAYTGAAITPTPTVTFEGRTLAKGAEYSVAYSSNVVTGTASVTITGCGTYRGSAIATFTVATPMSSVDLTGVALGYSYEGTPVVPVPSLRLGAYPLVEGRDYQLTYTRNGTLGIGYVTVTGVNGFIGTKTRCFRIDRAVGFAPAIEAGRSCSLGLRPDGTVVAVGYNYGGILDVSGWTDIVALCTGDYHSVGLRRDGTLVTAGGNTYGQRNVSSWTSVTAIAAGYFTTYGLRTDGTVLATGDNSYGQCNVEGWRDIVAISAAGHHVIALRSDGTLIGAGTNDAGESSPPFVRPIAIAASPYNSYGLWDDGTVQGVGYGGYGGLLVDGWRGVAELAPQEYGVFGRKADGSVIFAGNAFGWANKACGWAGIVALAAESHHVLGLRADGSVVATGATLNGQSDVDEWYLPPTTESLATGTVSVSSRYCFTGASVEPTPTVRVRGRTLVPVLDFAWEYSDNTSVGAATVRVSGRGAYTGSAESTFAVVPSLSATELRLFPQQRATLGASGGSGITTWVSSDLTVASVSTTGTVRAVKAGTAYVFALRNGGLMSCRIVVSNPTLSASAMNLFVSEADTLTVSGGDTLTKWSSSNTAVATVTGAGGVRARGAGTAYVYAVRNGVKLACKVVVKKHAYTIALGRSVLGARGYFTASVSKWDGSPAKGRSVTFYRNGVKVGSATTDASGTARIAVTKSRSELTCRVSVAGDALSQTTVAQAILWFAEKVADVQSTGSVETSAVLASGSYRLCVYGDGLLMAQVGTQGLVGADGTWLAFTIAAPAACRVDGWSSTGGVIRIVVWRYI